VRERLETFLAHTRSRDQPAPRFVEPEFRAYLRCGVLAHWRVRRAGSRDCSSRAPMATTTPSPATARPALASDRLEERPDGDLALRLKTRWRDGTTHVLMEPHELLERLLPLIPPPRAHQVRYHGVLAPCASARGPSRRLARPRLDRCTTRALSKCFALHAGPLAAGAPRGQRSDMTFIATDLTPRIGSEIRADLATLMSGSKAQEIRRLLEERGVAAFREINLSDEQQVAFTKTLGQIVDEGENNIYKITMDPAENAQAEYLKGAFYWHIDGTMSDVPILASIMSSRRLSPTGGQTEFSNTYAAYDDLPESEKKALEKLKVVHMLEVTQRYVNPEPTYAELRAWQKLLPRTLPLVWKHRSGRKSLVLGSTASHVEEMDLREGWALLTRLREWATQPQFVYRHEWKLGDLVIWDNTGTMHRALPYPLDSGRLMHRTKLHGEEPFV